MALFVDQVSIADPTQILGASAQNRELCASTLFDNGDRNGVEIAGSASRASTLRIAVPFRRARSAHNVDELVDASALEVVVFTATRADDGVW